MNFSPQLHIIFSPTVSTNPEFYIFYLQFLSQHVFPNKLKSRPTMVVWNLFRYAVLNITVEKHQVAFPIHDRKWLDPHDKGADRNVASFQANCRQERKKSPLAKEHVAGSPPKIHPSPVGVAQVDGVGMATTYSAAADFSNLEEPTYSSASRHGGLMPNPRSSPSKGEKDAMDGPKALITGSHSSIVAADPSDAGAPTTTGNHLPARRDRSERGGRDSQMAIKSFWDNAFKMSERVPIG